MHILSRVTREVQVSAGGVYNLGYHAVWCPKYRLRVLAGPVAGRSEGLIRAKASGHDWRMMALEIMPDHVRLFVEAHPSDCPSPIASQFKGLISRRLRAEFPHRRSRLRPMWSRLYFAATVGVVFPETVRRYIDRQNERSWWKERAR